MIQFLKQKNKKAGFARLVDFKEATPSRTPKGASLKITTGFTLIEVLVALFIFSISIIAILATLSQGTASISSTKKKIVAEYLAQEGIEYVRNLRDGYFLETPANWNSFRTSLIQCTESNRCIITRNNEVNFYPCGTTNECPPLVFNASTGRYSHPEISLNADWSEFIRYIYTEPLGNDEIKVFSVVKWDGGNKSITFSENLYNWME